MHSLTILLLIFVHGLGTAAIITWVYDSALLAELSNVLPGDRPKMYLRRDFDDWLITTRTPNWLQALLTCGKCGTAHASFWLTVPTAWCLFHRHPGIETLVCCLLIWLGSAGFSMFLKKQLSAS